MTTQSPPGENSSLFLDACAIINYVKPHIIRKLSPGRDIPHRVTIIRDFIIKCNEKRLKPETSVAAYEQAKKYRNFFRREFSSRFSQRTIDRVISATEQKIKNFFKRIKVHKNVSNRYYNDVESFFKKFETDPRMVETWKRKCKMSGLVFSSTMPDDSDIEILAQALTLKDPIFVTTDSGHFGVLCKEIEENFDVFMITHKNALERMRKWKWL